jgi:hypothetical protein
LSYSQQVFQWLDVWFFNDLNISCHPSFTAIMYSKLENCLKKNKGGDKVFFGDQVRVIFSYQIYSIYYMREKWSSFKWDCEVTNILQLDCLLISAVSCRYSLLLLHWSGADEPSKCSECIPQVIRPKWEGQERQEDRQMARE